MVSPCGGCGARVSSNGEGGWIYLSAVLAKEPIALVACDNDCWEIRYSFHLLGVLNDRTHTITHGPTVATT